MCIFKSKKLTKEIEELRFRLHAMTAERDEALKKIDSLSQEVTAKRNIIRQQDERIEKLKKRVKTQQDIIEKQNAKLGVEPKNKKKSGEAVVTPLPNIRKYTKDEDLHDPFPEE